MFSLDVIDTVDGPRGTSERFCATDAEVVFRSVDSMLFHIHRRYLENNTEGFSAPDIRASDEVVPLTETSTTLELLFQFIYPARHPDLETTDFSILAPLAEAAEKYQVYSAMVVCKIRMKNTLPKHSKDIISYAVKHDYPDILIEAAPLMLDQPLTEIIAAMPNKFVIPWVIYHGAWTRVAQTALSGYEKWNITSHRNKKGAYQLRHCQSCDSVLDAVITAIVCKLGRGVASLRDLDNVFNPKMACCQKNKMEMASWRSSIEEDIQKIPKLSFSSINSSDESGTIHSGKGIEANFWTSNSY